MLGDKIVEAEVDSGERSVIDDAGDGQSVVVKLNEADVGDANSYNSEDILVVSNDENESMSEVNEVVV